MDITFPRILLCIVFSLLSVTSDLWAQDYIMPHNSISDLRVKGGKLYDHGGADGNYLDNSSDTLILRPDSAGQFIRLKFRIFDLDWQRDTLYIYNGAQIGQNLIGAFLQSPTTVYSTDSSGALCLHFRSDETNSPAGFEAEIIQHDWIHFECAFVSVRLYQEAVVSGEFLSYDVKFRNEGPEAIYQCFHETWISDDTISDASDFLLRRFRQRSMPGYNQYNDIHHDTILEFLDPGDYYLINQIVDASGNPVGDSEKSRIHTPFTIIAKENDLSITALSIAPNLISSGSASQLSFLLENDGNARVENLSLGVYLSEDLYWGPEDTCISHFSVPLIYAQQSIELDHPINPFDSEGLEEGLYYLLAVADDDLEIEEVDEANNVMATQVLFIPEPDHYDLELSDFSPICDSALTGQDIRASFNIVNHSTLDLDQFMFSTFLSEDEQYDPDDLLLAESQIASLNVGMAYQGELSFMLDDTLAAGDYFLIAFAESEQVYEENHENNNISSLPFSIITESAEEDLDLHIDSLLLPEFIASGESSTMSIGLGLDHNASLNIRFEAYLSTDSLFDESDLQHSISMWNEYIPSRTALQLESFFQIAESYETGKYFLILKGDSDDLFAEDDEINNIAIVPFTLEPRKMHGDLLAADLQISESIFNLQSQVSGSFKYGSVGEGRIDSLFASIHLNPIGESGSDILVWQDTLRGNIGEANQHSFAFLLPDTLSEGIYFLSVSLEMADSLPDQDPENNRIGQVIAVQVPDIDFIVESALADTSIVHAGDWLVLSYSFQNQGSTYAENLSLACFISDDPLYSSEDVLVASKIHADLCIGRTYSEEWQLQVPENMETGEYYILIVADPDQEIEESDRSNNLFHFSQQVLESGSNLQLTGLEINADTVASRSRIILNSSLINSGNRTAPTYLWSYYFSRDTVFDEGDILMHTASMSGLYSGRESEYSFEYEISLAQELGSFYVLSCADPADNLDELNEEDNCSYVPLEVVARNVDLSFVEVQLPDTLGLSPGTQMDYKFSVMNNGIHPLADTLSYSIYYSLDEDFDPLIDSMIQSEELYFEILKGKTMEFESWLDIPDTLKMGTYHLFMELDSGSEVEETDEDNNVAHLVAQIMEANVDLLIRNIKPVDDSLIMYGFRDLSFELVNIGGTSSMIGSTCNFYLSSDSILDSKDFDLKSFEVPRVFGGEKEKAIHNTFIPGTIDTGYYYLIGVADELDQVVEINEQNNISKSRVYIHAPDLDLVTADLELLSDQVAPGSWITVNGKIKNLGTRNCYYPFAISKYISLDTIVDESDYQLTDMKNVKLNAEKETSFGIGSMLLLKEPEFYYLLLFIDSKGFITESNEENNVSWVRFRLTGKIKRPDFTSLSYQLDWTSDSVEVTVLAKNVGDKASASPVPYHVFHSADSIVDSTDMLVSSGFLETMAVNESQSYSFKLSREEGDPGMLLTIIDPDDQVEELNEQNNAFAIYLPAEPYDIACKLIMTGSVFRPGDTLSFQTDISNLSELHFDSISYSYCLLGKGGEDLIDQVLKSGSTFDVSPHEVRSLIEDLVLPSDLIDGDYTITLLVHEQFMYEELNRDNNHDSLTFMIDRTLDKGNLYPTQSKIRIYPNPVNNVLNIDSKEMVGRYMIVNSSGKAMISGQLNTKRGSISVDGLKEDTYFFVVDRDGASKVLQFEKIGN